MINKFKYGQTRKIWPSPLSSSFYSTFKFLIFYTSLIIACIVPHHVYLLERDRFLKNITWSRMSNFLKPQQKLENLYQSWWNYRFKRFERKFNKYSETKNPKELLGI